MAGTFRAILFQEVVKPPVYWNKSEYIPTGEIQKSARADFMACVIYSGVRCISFQINKMIADDILDLEKLKPWLDKNGKFNGCERGLSILAKTTKSGNTQMRVGDAIDDYGIAPEWIYPNPDPNRNATWEEYHSISQAKLNEVKDWGKKWLEYFSTRYERLPDSKAETLEYHLRQAPLWWATACCPGWGYSQIIPACSQPPVHATTGYGERAKEYLNDLDHYQPFEKKLAWNYPIYYPYKIVVYPNQSILKKKLIKEKNMLQRKEGTDEVFLTLGEKLYWIKDQEDFNLLKQSQPIQGVQWENVNKVAEIEGFYDGRIIGKPDFKISELLTMIFAKMAGKLMGIKEREIK